MTHELHRSFRQHLHPPICAVTVPTDPSTTIARVELSLTLYLADPAHWARTGAARLLRSFLALVPTGFLTLFRTSLTPRWLSLDSSREQELADLLSLPWAEGAPRHLFRMEVVDDPHCASCGFTYTEIDPARSECAPVIELTLPQEFDPGHLLPLARAALEAGPLGSGIGGYAVRMNQAYLADAFDLGWAWSRRFVGLDIQFPEQMAWRATRGLPGTNWLTLLGRPVAEAAGFELQRAEEHPWVDPFVRVERADDNLLIVAGEAPTTGDRHFFDEAGAYREVAETTRALLAPAPDFLGRFRDERGSEAWFRRLTRRATTA